MARITDWQKKRIHVLASKLGLVSGVEDGPYRDMLEARAGVRSSLNLTYTKARDLIEGLEREATDLGVWKQHRWTAESGRLKYEDLGHRPGMASPAQLRMIEAIWKEVSYQATDEEKERAFRRFLNSHYHVVAIEWIEDWQAKKIIRTLNAMRDGREAKDGEAGAASTDSAARKRVYRLYKHNRR